jgi:SAM-dependent methyltransferase
VGASPRIRRRLAAGRAQGYGTARSRPTITGAPELGNRFAALAFGPAARVYEALTGSAPWSESCRRLATLVPGPRVLDLGIGPGASALEAARAAPDRRVVGLDLAAAMLHRVRDRAARAGVALPLVRADALRLPVRSGALDGATGHSLLYLLPDPSAALADVARAVRPGGRVAFLEPSSGAGAAGPTLRAGPRFATSMALWRLMSALHRRFDPPALAALLAGAGFGEIRIEPALYGFGWLAHATR